MIKLNIGCGPDLRKDYVNIDLDGKEEIERRYGIKVSDDIIVENYNVFDLPYYDEEVDEILCLGFLEHLSFEEEKEFFDEVDRVLKPGGEFHFTVPDFESLVQQWLQARDDFKDFYTTDPEACKAEHWFGNYSRTLDNRWGYLTASIFGNQNGQGQYHRNAYTVGKIFRILEIYEWSAEFYTFYFKDTGIKMLGVKVYK